MAFFSLRNPGWAGLFLSLLLVGCSTGASSRTTLRKAPYLVFPGDPTTMQVLWQARATVPGAIAWGTDTGYSSGSAKTREFGADHQHSFTLTGLTPGRLYYYRVVSEGTPYTGFFRAAAPADSRRLEFLAYGDTRLNVAVHDTVAGQMLEAIGNDPELRTLVVSVGDLTSDGDSEEVWDREFFSPEYRKIQQMLAGLPYQSCRGNHERSGLLFGKYFPYPFAGSRYWSFDYGPAHFTVLDQYVSYEPGSPQYEWLESDLAKTTRTWRFVVLHAPGWSAGGGHRNARDVQDYLQPLFTKYGVSLVFGGHNHYYARAVVDGVQHLTIGGGGAPLYTPEPGAPNIVTTASSYHYCRIRIDGDRLGFAAVSGTTVLDTFEIAAPVPAGSR